MAPAARQPSIEHTTEYDEFIERLREFHEERGTSFEPEPKVGSRRVDLLRLYKRVVGDGGYDVVSDTKASKLAWRKIGQDFNLGHTNLPTLAFSLKTVYYKTLAAYEIVHIHNKEPPPKDILEDLSAKGGNLLTRTYETFHRPGTREGRHVNGDEQDESEEEVTEDAPKEDPMDVDDSSTGVGGRTRGLRQAPPQRTLFQSDVSSQRQTRHSSGQINSPAPSANTYVAVNGSQSTSSAAQALANYEPKPQFPLTLRPVTTPANNPELFRANQTALRDAALARGRKPPSQPKGALMLPGTGFQGPNIYIRTFMSLRSTVPEEQEYALHHLVKISHERGDKYRLDNFSGLAEVLIDKVLEASSLFFDVNWKVSYQENAAAHDVEILDGLNGTSDIIARIQSAPPRRPTDKMETIELSQKLKLINEAGLVLRNMSMLEENAEYLSTYPAMCDAITILMNLPPDACVSEIRQYSYEIAEQVTKYLSATSDNALIRTLVASITSTDRGIILSSLRAISRIGSNLEYITPLPEIPRESIRRLCEWLLVEDQDLRAACLDFLYRFTAGVENVETLMSFVDIESLVQQLVRLLQYSAREEAMPDITIAPKHLPITPANTEPPQIPKIPSDLVDQLLGYDEPERSSQWLKACFEEDPTGEITQIALWQAYQIPFAPFSVQRPLLPAKDFITNVSSTFSHASAQVMGGDPPRFVIKGIKPREAPIGPGQHRSYMRCRWQLDDGSQCPEFALWPKQMWEHIISDHLKVIKDSDGQYDFTPVDSKTYECRWGGCKKFDGLATSVSPFKVGMHVKTHLPDSSNMAHQRGRHNKGGEQESASRRQSPAWTMRNTMTDDRHDATGLPLTSALVLRNIARNLHKTAASEKEGGDNIARSVFAPVRAQLYFVMAYNRPLGEYIAALTRAIDATSS